MLGYFGSRQQPLDDEGWLHTGDLAVMDAEGFIRIVGRKKDMIIRGGQNVFPWRIEAYLAKMPGIREVAVVGVPAPLAGEEVWAFIVPEKEAQLTPQEILAYCRQGLEIYEVPQHIRLVSDLPRTSTGKPQKYKLRQIVLEERSP